MQVSDLFKVICLGRLDGRRSRPVDTPTALSTMLSHVLILFTGLKMDTSNKTKNRSRNEGQFKGLLLSLIRQTITHSHLSQSTGFRQRKAALITI